MKLLSQGNTCRACKMHWCASAKRRASLCMDALICRLFLPFWTLFGMKSHHPLQLTVNSSHVISCNMICPDASETVFCWYTGTGSSHSNSEEGRGWRVRSLLSCIQMLEIWVALEGRILGSMSWWEKSEPLYFKLTITAVTSKKIILLWYLMSLVGLKSSRQPLRNLVISVWDLLASQWTVSHPIFAGPQRLFV